MLPKNFRRRRRQPTEKCWWSLNAEHKETVLMHLIFFLSDLWISLLFIFSILHTKKLPVWYKTKYTDSDNNLFCWLHACARRATETHAERFGADLYYIFCCHFTYHAVPSLFSQQWWLSLSIDFAAGKAIDCLLVIRLVSVYWHIKYMLRLPTSRQHSSFCCG